MYHNIPNKLCVICLTLSFNFSLQYLPEIKVVNNKKNKSFNAKTYNYLETERSKGTDVIISKTKI